VTARIARWCIDNPSKVYERKEVREEAARYPDSELDFEIESLADPEER
jgi:hypothetical protein